MKKMTSALLVLSLFVQTAALAADSEATAAPAASSTTAEPASVTANREALQKNNQEIQAQIQEIKDLQTKLDKARAQRNAAVVLAGSVATISTIIVAAHAVGAFVEIGGSLIEAAFSKRATMRNSEELISDKALLYIAGGSATVGVAVVTFKAFEITKIKKTLETANLTLQAQLEQNSILLQQQN